MERTERRAATRAEVRPATPRQRATRAARNGGEPTLEFTGRVPYDAYVHASTLHRLQAPLSSDPGEMSFLVISQIMELYFNLTCHELRETQQLLRADRVREALSPLRRAALHLEGLNAAWRSLRWMTPADFNRFRNLLGEGSGFQSAMYRHLELLLGLRDPALIRPFRRQSEVHAELTAALNAPSLWDDVLALLARQGYDLPRELLGRDVAEEHQPHPAVEAAWVQIYTDGPDNQLRMLGEALSEVAEWFGDWRWHHVKAVQRTMGAKVGSGGSAGLAWLQRSMARVVFPELWSARTAM
ncbi:tryptophan 2,3-dioxygenase [Salinispora arenicola]|uniref:Tryptophan 2,3-dioxygenase n=1 Tax=Salinispora arenicola TaxID=168697 RepID=A0A542XNJ3_SALAC|nr:tryptophan 2,3-dioxygenase family protein [Salinispora arenicola]MCN0154060.1 tryptophan 2,3-dioxygenase family protein [Salinispora arenicola]TQL37426.1 tryptophan 2,3-dioxygenase [Salinispora arenicola]GIM87302.1 tryptophan 2,3-dioxygenase [Salinispora arenicola]